MPTQPMTLDNPDDHRVFYSRDVVLKWRNYLSQFEVTEPFDVLWVDDKAHTRVQFTVKAGFMTDLASIPRVVRSLIPQVAHHLQPSVVHDWLYEYDEGLTRLLADQMFLEGMRDEGVGRIRRNLMYQGVRAGGGGAWGPGDGGFLDLNPWDVF